MAAPTKIRRRQRARRILPRALILQKTAGLRASKGLTLVAAREAPREARTSNKDTEDKGLKTTAGVNLISK